MVLIAYKKIVLLCHQSTHFVLRDFERTLQRRITIIMDFRLKYFEYWGQM
jgi:hypothetical protein